MRREEVHTAAGPTVKEDMVEMSLGVTHLGQVVLAFLALRDAVSRLLLSWGHAYRACFPGSARVCLLCVWSWVGASIHSLSPSNRGVSRKSKYLIFF